MQVVRARTACASPQTLHAIVLRPVPERSVYTVLFRRGESGVVGKIFIGTARFVPRQFGNVRRGRLLRGAVVRGPVAAAGFIELGAAHGHAVPGRGLAVGRITSGFERLIAIALGRTGVAGGHENADALRRSLLEQLIIERIAARAFRGFASAVADADDVGDVLLDHIHLRKRDAVHQPVRRSNHHVDGGIGSDAARDFRVEIRFRIVANHHARVVAGVNEVGIVNRKVEHLTVGLHVAQENIRTGRDSNRHAGSIDSVRQQGRSVVDRCEVGWANKVVAGTVRVLRAGLQLAQLCRGCVVALLEEVIQSRNARDHRPERLGNRDVAIVRHVRLAVRHQVVMHFHLERFFELSAGAAELDRALRLGNVLDLQAVALHPGGHFGDIIIMYPEVLAELFRRRPLMVVRGALVLLLVNHLARFALLLRARLQHQDQMLRRRIRSDPSQFGRVA